MPASTTPPQEPASPDDDVRRVFLFGCPRSRTTVAQRVISQAAGLATMPSTNWFLEHASTRILNGMDGSSREEARAHAIDRVRTHLRVAAGVDMPDGFGLAEALDRLAVERGAVGWLEKTPLHVLSIPEIEAEVPGARFVHFIRDPAGVVRSLIRRARANPGMFGATYQLDQKHDEATWRACVTASLNRHGQANHLLVHSETFVDDPEAVARRVAGFLDLPYRDTDNPARMAAAAALVPSHRPWKRDAAGPVARIEHADDDPQLEPLDASTVELWQHAQTVLGISDPADHSPHPAGS